MRANSPANSSGALSDAGEREVYNGSATSLLDCLLARYAEGPKLTLWCRNTRPAALILKAGPYAKTDHYRFIADLPKSALCFYSKLAISS